MQIIAAAHRFFLFDYGELINMEDYKIQAELFRELSDIIGNDTYRAAEIMKKDGLKLVTDAKTSLIRIVTLNNKASYRSIYDAENGGRFNERNPGKYDNYVVGLNEYYFEILNEIKNVRESLEMLRDVIDGTLDQMDAVQDALDSL